MNTEDRTSRNFKGTGDPEKYGQIKMFKSPVEKEMQTLYDIAEGVFLGLGRKVGEGQNEIDTLILVDVETGEVNLLFAHTVLLNELKKAYKAEGIDLEKPKDFKPFYLSVKYKGKKLSSSGSKYHDYELRYSECELDEEAYAKELLNVAQGK